MVASIKNDKKKSSDEETMQTIPTLIWTLAQKLDFSFIIQNHCIIDTLFLHEILFYSIEKMIQNNCGVWLKIAKGTSAKVSCGAVITEFSYNNWMGLGTKV